MSLPYVRKPEYLSPSSLRSLEADPGEFYLQRCGPVEVRPFKFEQTPQMAVGSVFDAYVKAELAKRLGLPCPPLEKLMENVEPQNRGDTTIQRDNAPFIINPLVEGKKIFDAYVLCGALKGLIDEGVHAVELEPAIEHCPGTVRTLMGKEIGGVPIKGHPDCLLRHDDDVPCVLDWKVTSAGSPTPGYRRIFSMGDPTAQYAPPHERADEPLEALNEEWAMQLATYSWLLRKRVGMGAYFMPVRVAIDQVVYGGAHVRVAQFRTHISGKFQTSLRQRYIDAWEKIQDEKLVDGDNLDLVRLTRGA